MLIVTNLHNTKKKAKVKITHKLVTQIFKKYINILAYYLMVFACVYNIYF